MNQEVTRQLFEMLLSWLRVFLAAAIAVYSTTGRADWNTMANAGFAAVIPVILRWLDPMDKNYGRGAGES